MEWLKKQNKTNLLNSKPLAKSVTIKNSKLCYVYYFKPIKLFLTNNKGTFSYGKKVEHLY